jgi:hypothetical protein
VTCLDEHGEDRDRWPEWVTFLVSDNERLRWEDRCALRCEVSLPPDVMERYDDFLVPEQMMTRPLSQMAWSENSARMLIPADPYSDDLSNQQYRAANGVIEEEL